MEFLFHALADTDQRTHITFLAALTPESPWQRESHPTQNQYFVNSRSSEKQTGITPKIYSTQRSRHYNVTMFSSWAVSIVDTPDLWQSAVVCTGHF